MLQTFQMNIAYCSKQTICVFLRCYRKEKKNIIARAKANPKKMMRLLIPETSKPRTVWFLSAFVERSWVNLTCGFSAMSARWSAQKEEWSYYVETEVSGHSKCLACLDVILTLLSQTG